MLTGKQERNDEKQMGLIKDMQEARSLWTGSSWYFKFAIIVATFLATSSITSLSDVVFHWKGFILEGIQFYQAWITHPIKEFALRFNFVLTREAVDYLVLTALFFFSGSRKSFTMEGVTVRNIFGVALNIFLLFFMASLLSGFSGNNNRILTLWACSISVLFYLALPIIVKASPKEKFIYYTPCMIAIATVLILAAINSGIVRPLV